MSWQRAELVNSGDFNGMKVWVRVGGPQMVRTVDIDTGSIDGRGEPAYQMHLTGPDGDWVFIPPRFIKLLDETREGVDPEDFLIYRRAHLLAKTLLGETEGDDGADPESRG